MLACGMVVGETVLPAFDQRSQAKQCSHRRVKPDALPAVAQLDLQSLSHLVFDGLMLVAAFARRDDAEEWIEQCGHPAMKLGHLPRPSDRKRRRRKNVAERQAEL